MSKIELLNIDCMEYMKGCEDNAFDLILTDPPYGTTACKWDSIIPLEPMWKQLRRIIKPNGAIIMTASQPFTSILVSSNMKMFKCEWIWEKNRGSNFAILKYQPMKEHESVLVFGEGRVNYYPIKEQRKGGGSARTKYKYNPTNTGKREVMGGFEMKHANHNGNEELRYPSSIQKFNVNVGLHPTQKPVALMEYLIEGERVLDFAMGSGTTCIACVNTKRDFVGCELDKDYYNAAVNRFNEETKQRSMF